MSFKHFQQEHSSKSTTKKQNGAIGRIYRIMTMQHDLLGNNRASRWNEAATRDAGKNLKSSIFPSSCSTRRCFSIKRERQFGAHHADSICVRQLKESQGKSWQWDKLLGNFCLISMKTETREFFSNVENSNGSYAISRIILQNYTSN